MAEKQKTGCILCRILTSDFCSVWLFLCKLSSDYSDSHFCFGILCLLVYALLQYLIKVIFNYIEFSISFKIFIFNLYSFIKFTEIFNLSFSQLTGYNRWLQL